MRAPWAWKASGLRRALPNPPVRRPRLVKRQRFSLGPQFAPRMVSSRRGCCHRRRAPANTASNHVTIFKGSCCRSSCSTNSLKPRSTPTSPGTSYGSSSIPSAWCPWGSPTSLVEKHLGAAGRLKWSSSRKAPRTGQPEPKPRPPPELARHMLEEDVS